MRPGDNASRAGRYAGPDARIVRQMFADIARRYDFLNHCLSLSVDRWWRWTTARKAREWVPDAQVLCLDLCSGTGDMALELHRQLGSGVIASDFCHPMLTRSNRKIRSAGWDHAVIPVEADALVLPFADDAFGVVTNAFGLRNLENPVRGLVEMHRILQPGGHAMVLEFSTPVVSIFRHLFLFYFNHILPWLGTVISGRKGPYQYLSSSVKRFPDPNELRATIRSIGFVDVEYRYLSGGIAALHWGRKPSVPQRK